MNRRTVLKAGLVIAATSHAATNAPETPVVPVSVDDFLRVATPAEVARYHTNALLEALSEMRPDLRWAAFTDIDASNVSIQGMVA